MNKSLLGTLLIGATILLFFVFFMPAYDELGQAHEAQADRVQLLADANTAKANLAKLNKEYDENQEAIKRILVALPAKRQLDYITSSIHIAATEAGMELSSFTLSEPQLVEESGYATIPINLQLVGTYSQFKTFTEKLEKSLRLYDIARLDISTTEKDALSNSLSITMQMVTYSLK